MEIDVEFVVAARTTSKSGSFQWASGKMGNLSELYYGSSCLFNWIHPFGIQNLSQECCLSVTAEERAEAHWAGCAAKPEKSRLAVLHPSSVDA
jgi:hypothetical protein